MGADGVLYKGHFVVKINSTISVANRTKGVQKIHANDIMLFRRDIRIDVFQYKIDTFKKINPIC